MEGLQITGSSLTRTAAEDILTTGIEAGIHGIGGWAQVVSVQRNRDKTIRLARITDVEADVPKEFTLTHRDIATAVNTMLRDPKGTDSEGWVGRFFDTGDGLDGPACDAIIQVACHGKVIYG